MQRPKEPELGICGIKRLDIIFGKSLFYQIFVKKAEAMILENDENSRKEWKKLP